MVGKYIIPSRQRKSHWGCWGWR